MRYAYFICAVMNQLTPQAQPKRARLARAPAPGRSKKNAVKLPNVATDGQREAFDALLRFCAGHGAAAARILSGYAGTGKTWLTVYLVRAACALGLRVAVCAPTHKAVSVISSKLDADGGSHAWTGTVHSLLGLKLTENHDGEMSLKLDRGLKSAYFEDYDVVIIDEASMIGPMLLSYIDRFRRGHKPRVLYVGDPGQLLPVEPEGSTVHEDDMPLLAPLFAAQDHAVDFRSSVFRQTADRYDLSEVVRQKATGRPHPIVQFAQEIRHYIEDDTRGVFGPDEIHAYLSAHADEFGGAVRVANAHHLGEGAVMLRRRRPNKDIRVVCWRNRVVDERNRSIHLGLASVYGADDPHCAMAQAPYWPGEVLVAREALYGFRPSAGIHQRGDQAWEAALSPDPDLKRGGAPRDDLADIIQNNTEMTVRLCEPFLHPYLQIPSWRVHAELPDGDLTEFYIADRPQVHQKMTRDTWAAYRRLGHRVPSEFRHAWAVTRACAPVMHAYAVTAHKSQGSTFDYTLVDMSDLCGMIANGSDDYHRALYVAVTRAAERVWLCF